MLKFYMKPELRRALMRLNPDFFKMSKRAQELYCIRLSSDQQQQLTGYVRTALFGDNAGGYDLSPDQSDSFNETIQPARGIGEDCFSLNEHLRDKTLLDFKSYYEFDYGDHLYQQSANKRDFKGYKEKSYRGCVYRRWVRLFINDEFIYADVQSSAGRIFDILVDDSIDVVQKHIPYKLVEGRNHGASEKGGFRFNLVKDADGKEAELEELMDRQNQYIATRSGEITDEWFKRANREVYIFDDESFGSRSTNFIFSDPEAMKCVRFEHFLSDCRELEFSKERLFDYVENERKALRAHTVEQFADIGKNFDPTIIKLRKKRKIILAPQAIDDLNTLHDK